MKNLTRTAILWLGFGGFVLVAGAALGGYSYGKQENPTSVEATTNLWEIDSSVISRRSITVKGEILDILENGLVIQSQNNETNETDQLAIPATADTQIYLTIRREGKSEAPSLITLSQVQVGDRADAVLDISATGEKATTSLAIWRDL